jgi:hypothetical protein
MYQDHFNSCIDACNDCAVACHRCAAACLKEEDPAEMVRCIQLDVDCAHLCRLAAGYMSRGSELAAELCRLSAAVCDICDEECARHAMSQCQDCAKACRRCARECRRMASAQAKARPAQRSAASVH